MIPLRYFTVPRSQIERITMRSPLPRDYVRDYEKLRPDVLRDDAQDIFAINSRTEKQQWLDGYDLFERSPYYDRADFIVCQNWLEMSLAAGVRQNIATIVDGVRMIYEGMPAVWSWNHDADQASIAELQYLPGNEYVLSYNTSRPNRNDVLVPFWNVDTRMNWDVHHERTPKAIFIGAVAGVSVRKALMNLRNAARFTIVNADAQGRMQPGDYLAFMKQYDFALCPRGGGLSSYRFWEALQCGCIPILFADLAILPFRDVPWDDICIRIPECYANDAGYLESRMDGCDVAAMRRKIQELRPRFALAGVQQEIYGRLKHLIQRRKADGDWDN